MSWNVHAAVFATQIPFPYTASCYFCTIPHWGLSLTLFRTKPKLYKAVFCSTPETESLILSFLLFPQQPGLECSQTAVGSKSNETGNFWNWLCHCCWYLMELCLYTAHEFLIIARELQKPLLESKQRRKTKLVAWSLLINVQEVFPNTLKTVWAL